MIQGLFFYSFFRGQMMIGLGTIVNVFAIIIGGILGIFFWQTIKSLYAGNFNENSWFSRVDVRFRGDNGKNAISNQNWIK